MDRFWEKNIARSLSYVAQGDVARVFVIAKACTRGAHWTVCISKRHRQISTTLPSTPLPQPLPPSPRSRTTYSNPSALTSVTVLAFCPMSASSQASPLSLSLFLSSLLSLSQPVRLNCVVLCSSLLQRMDDSPLSLLLRPKATDRAAVGAGGGLQRKPEALTSARSSSYSTSNVQVWPSRDDLFVCCSYDTKSRAVAVSYCTSGGCNFIFFSCVRNFALVSAHSTLQYCGPQYRRLLYVVEAGFLRRTVLVVYLLCMSYLYEGTKP